MTNPEVSRLLEEGIASDQINLDPGVFNYPQQRFEDGPHAERYRQIKELLKGLSPQGVMASDTSTKVARVLEQLRQLKVEATDRRWNGMQRDLVADLDRDVSQLAADYDSLARRLLKCEKVVETAREFECNLSEYCDGPERDALRTALSEVEE